PLTATPGIRRMRVRVVYGSSSAGFDACSSYSWGEAHDYNVNILALTQCSGAVTAGAATASATSVCATIPFNVSLNGVTIGGGITYQWQSSPAGANTFTNISGATNLSYVVANQTVATDYRCVVTCTNSNSTSTSTIVSVGQNPYTQCYCTPVYAYGCNSLNANINSFVIEGEGASEISDLGTGCNNDDGTSYSIRTSLFSPVDLFQDGEYDVQINTSYTSPQYVTANIWIDFNDNGAFETTEQLLSDFVLALTPSFATSKISIPDSAPPGIHRMRVRTAYSTPGIDACSSVNYGETHDYEVNVIAVTCYRPLDVQLSDVTKNSALVTLTPNAKNTGNVTYAYEVRESGKPGSGTTGLAVSGIATTNPFTVTGLQYSTEYTVYVKTVCSSTDSSGWTKSS